jgi:bifunctional DNase/RNase
MTHDLMKDLLDALGANVERVVVSEVRDATYFAEIHLAVGGRALELSSRPSDAIALAARTHSPLFVEDELMESAGVVLDDDEDDDDEAPEEIVGEFREFLERVRPEDFTT